MLAVLSGFAFVISIVAFIVFVILGLFKNRKINKKTWLWLVAVVVSMIIGATTAKTPENNQTKTENQSKVSSSSRSTKQPTDNNVVESLKNDLKSGNMVEFLKTYYAQDRQNQLDYYQKAEVATTKTTIKGQVIERNTSGTRLYIYVPVEDMPANVRQTKQNAYVVVVKDDNGSLKNFAIGQPAEVTGYLVSRGDKELGYNWDMRVAN
ncbi:hypothetical protein ACQ7EN_08215 [Leuconostoc lactis]|uniref:hypothetical protein n=1 Tax=Leuconostoc lactis TaxID=1246 RepID=UPI003D6B4CC5